MLYSIIHRFSLLSFLAPNSQLKTIKFTTEDEEKRESFDGEVLCPWPASVYHTVTQFAWSEVIS